jgi:hypothetical protein
VAGITLVLCTAYSSTLNMQATCSSEISFAFRQSSRHYIPEDINLHNYRYENLKSYEVLKKLPVKKLLKFPKVKYDIHRNLPLIDLHILLAHFPCFEKLKVGL